jgi:SpoVK/Ycf46/Vps4 family AAA+-type ATPase
MDGLSARQNLVVIGATNRPAHLALTRPGRFDKVIYLDLPAKRKRFELFKFYSQVGIEDRINWDYFAKQTAGLSAAHISAMNSSLLKVISENYFSDYWKPAKKSRTNTFQFVPLIQDRIKLVLTKQ